MEKSYAMQSLQLEMHYLVAWKAISFPEVYGILPQLTSLPSYLQNCSLTVSSFVQLFSPVRLFCDPTEYSTPGFPVHHQLPELAQTQCPLSRWCHPTISSSAIPFSSCLQSFPASGSFPMNQLFASGGQSIGASASASVFLMNIKSWSPLGWTGWSPCSPRDSQESSPAPQFENINSSALSILYGPTLTSIHNSWKTFLI